MKLGEIVHSYRAEHGLTMQEFAEKSGLSKGYISMLENNKNPRNGQPITPSIETYDSIARAMDVSIDELLAKSKGESVSVNKKSHLHGVRIPVLGRVIAGIPIEAIEDIIDYEEIPEDMAKTGKFFALQVKGDSMLPTLHDGDVVIVRQQPRVESGEIAIVMVNGSDATVKEVKESSSGITLVGHNVAVYTPHFYSCEDIEKLPVRIIGKVVELRRKF